MDTQFYTRNVSSQGQKVSSSAHTAIRMAMPQWGLPEIDENYRANEVAEDGSLVPFDLTLNPKVHQELETAVESGRVFQFQLAGNFAGDVIQVGIVKS